MKINIEHIFTHQEAAPRRPSSRIKARRSSRWRHVQVCKGALAAILGVEKRELAGSREYISFHTITQSMCRCRHQKWPGRIQFRTERHPYEGNGSRSLGSTRGRSTCRQSWSEVRTWGMPQHQRVCQRGTSCRCTWESKSRQTRPELGRPAHQIRIRSWGHRSGWGWCQR